MRHQLHLLALLGLALAGCSKKSAAPAVGDGNDPKVKVTPAGKDIDKLLAELKSPSVERRAGAVSAFARADPAEAVSVLIDALADKGITSGAAVPGEPNSTREAAVLALLKIGAPA